IGRIPATGRISDYAGAGARPFRIVSGPDGALWFTDFAGNSIGRITTAGAITRYSSGQVDAPSGIAVGADGAVWFTNYGNGSIGRITTAGVITAYVGPSYMYQPRQIA